MSVDFQKVFCRTLTSPNLCDKEIDMILDEEFKKFMMEEVKSIKSTAIDIRKIGMSLRKDFR